MRGFQRLKISLLMLCRVRICGSGCGMCLRVNILPCIDVMLIFVDVYDHGL